MPKPRSWEGASAPTSTRSIRTIAEFLSTVVHVHVDAEILQGIGSVDSVRVLLTVLMDLCLLAKSDWPVDPSECLASLWKRLADESGTEHSVHTGIEMAKEQLERLKYPGASRFEHRNSHQLLSGVAWVLATTPVLEVYSRSHPVSTAVPPTPYSILGQAFKDGYASTHTQPSIGPDALSWQQVAQLANAAQRMHGRIDMLQKQLQQELVRNTKLICKLENDCEHANALHTPYELVAASSDVMQSHMDDTKALCQELDTRQRLSHLAPGFFEWVCKVVSSGEGNVQQQPEPHTLLLPEHLMQSECDVSKLQEVFERQGAAAQAALRSVQSTVASECPGSSPAGLSVPDITLPGIPTLDGIICSIQEHDACGGRKQVWSNQKGGIPAESVAPHQSGSCSDICIPRQQQPQNSAITMQGARAKSRYANLLKVSDFRPCVHDAARMQKLCLGLARQVAMHRVTLKKHMSDKVQETYDDLVLLGM